MTLVLVDTRDGSVVTEVETETQVSRAVDAWVEDDCNGLDDLCLIELCPYDDAVFGFDTSVKIRLLPERGKATR